MNRPMDDRSRPRRPAERLREDALAIWQAGVDAVRSDRLVREHVRVDGQALQIGGEEMDLEKIRRIFVVGAGKAGAGMAAGLEQALGEDVLQQKQVRGWINVPADCVRGLRRIHLHAARPAGVNEPTAEGVRGTEEILRLAAAATDDDLVIALISGGGSALLPAPIEGVSLSDKQRVTRFLSGAGANIEQLNTVRKQLSRIKGGGLARASRAGKLVTLIISDVLGDPLDVIASGPTVADPSTPEDALRVLEHFHADETDDVPQSIFKALRERSNGRVLQATATEDVTSGVVNLVIGNNAAAVDAAGIEAERRGYSHAMHASTELEQQAEEVGRHLARMAARMRDQPGPDCLITGGEPVVQLVDAAHRGKGGRNQQLVLAALIEMLAADGNADGRRLEGVCLLSGGTDGEDGPTDAAGAVIDAGTVEKFQSQGLDPAEHLRRNDAYHFFQPLGDLILTGPTHTNVCDLRVAVVDRIEQPAA